MGVGRPTVFCKEVCDKILEALEQGYNEKEACGYAGIGYRTFTRWKAEAEEHKTNTPKKCFFQDVDAAKSKGDYELKNPIIDAIINGKDEKIALRYAELRLKAKIARDAKESQDRLIDSIVEVTEDEVEWINHVSDYNSKTNARPSE